jgi:hypothetical protein
VVPAEKISTPRLTSTVSARNACLGQHNGH